MIRREVRVGTRSSELARAQTRWVVSELQRAAPGLRIAIETIRTEGDLDQQTPLPRMGGRGVFVREVERRLLAGDIDFAVHSLKDLPTDETPGLVITSVPSREDPRDALVTQGALEFESLPAGAVIGTGSPRRRAQLFFHRPEIRFRDVRGNIDTRIKRVIEGELDGVVLALAGLRRAGLPVPVRPIPLEISLPAAGQGALALQIREGDREIERLLALVDDSKARSGAFAERELLARLGGGCHAPVGVYCRPDGEGWLIEATVGLPDGAKLIRATHRAGDPMSAVDGVYQKLVEEGALQILAQAETMNC